MEDILKLSELKLIELAELRQQYIDEYVSNDTNKDRDSVKPMLDVVEEISAEMSERDWESEMGVEPEEYEDSRDRVRNLLIVVCVYALLAASAMFFFMSKVDYATFFLLTHYIAGSFASKKLSQ